MSFKQFDPQDIVVSADSLTGTAWSNNQPQLTKFFTSSVQGASQTGYYYLHVYQTKSTDTTSAVQFDITYGDVNGSGSLQYNPLVVGVKLELLAFIAIQFAGKAAASPTLVPIAIESAP